MSSHYDVLGVPETASEEEVKKAFRSLAKQHHPDKHGNDQDKARKMQELNDAYRVLSDREQRWKYDSSIKRNKSTQHHQQPFFSPEDMFNHFFQQTRRHQPPPPPPQQTPAVVVNVYLSVPEIVSGTDKTLDMEMDARCGKCNGCGANDPSNVRVCGHCMGRGIFVAVIPPLQMEQPCMVCKQKGYIISDADKCGACKGSGLRACKRSYVLQIPPGIANKTEVLLKGKGPCSDPRTGRNADLQVFIHHHFERPYSQVPDNPTWLGYEMQITLKELLAGFTKRIDLAPGRDKPPPIQLVSDGYFNPTNNVCVVPGYGLTTHGSLKVTFSVVFEDALDGVVVVVSKEGGEQEEEEEEEDSRHDNNDDDDIKVQVKNYLHTI
jgi:DnaJ-class molecular chaperone